METPPVIVDLVNGKMLKIGQDPQAREKLEQMMAAQRELAMAAGSDRPR